MELEPDHEWALASLAFARYRETGQPVYLDELAHRAADGNEQAARLERLAQPYFAHLPPPTDATIHMLEQLEAEGSSSEIGQITLSHLEPPSTRVAVNTVSKRNVAINILTVPKPDPRVAWDDVAYTIWRYDGTDPRPGLAHPQRADVIDAVVALARSAYNANAWYAAACEASFPTLDEETLRELLAVMVHPPLYDDARPWLGIQRVQFASAMLIASLDRTTAWPRSLRRRGLHTLIHGPLDWTTEAAVVALTTAAGAGDADEAEVLRWLTALYERRPAEGAWSLGKPLLVSMLRLPNLDRETRDRLREELRSPPLPPPEPRWKRWLTWGRRQLFKQRQPLLALLRKS